MEKSEQIVPVEQLARMIDLPLLGAQLTEDDVHA